MAQLPRSLASFGRITVIFCGLASSLLGLATPALSLECANYDCLPLVGSTPSNGASEVVVSGDYAYVAEVLGSLRVVDITDPSAPISVATVPTAGSANGVAVMGNYAYVAESSGLRVIDISNPIAPTVVGSVVTSEVARDVAVANSHAYLAVGSGMQVVDISNPQSPAIVGTALVVDNDALVAHAIGISDSFVYLASGWLDEFGGYLHVFDVANPVTPTLTSTVVTSGSARGVALTEAYAYVTDRGLMLVIGIGSGSATILEYLPLPGELEGIKTSGQDVYVASGGSGLQVLDISNPEQPMLIKHRETPGYALGVAVANDHVFIADGSALQVADFTEPCPQTMGRLDTSDAWDVAVAGDFAYVADSSSGMKVVDISNPEVPLIVGNLATPSVTVGVTVVGGYAYVACGNSGLMVVDSSNPNSPQLMGVSILRVSLLR